MWLSYSRKWCMLMFIPDCYKDQKMCSKAVDNYVHALWSFTDCYKIQQMCNKAASTFTFAI